MTTNIERASDVIDRWTQDGSELNSAVGSPHEIAEALADAGLLMPDLPEPWRSHDDPEWQEDYRQIWYPEFAKVPITPSVWTQAGEDTNLQVFLGTGQVRPAYLGEDEAPVDADEAWLIGLKWLAAAKLAKETTSTKEKQ